MQEQIDLMIIERVSNGFFNLVLPLTSHSRSIEREYKSRGFKVRSNDQVTIINWESPHIDSSKKPNKRIFSYFTADQLYNVLTQGKDLRHLTNAVIYEKLIREQSIIETYGMQKTTVYNLFSEAIIRVENEGYIVVVNDQGVISSNKITNFDVNDIRDIDKKKDTDFDDLLSIISRDNNNSLELGDDSKLYVNNPLKTQNW